MKTETVALIAVAEVWKACRNAGKAGKYMPPANGPKKPAAVTIPKMKRLLPGLNAEYGGLPTGFG